MLPQGANLALDHPGVMSTQQTVDAYSRPHEPHQFHAQDHYVRVSADRIAVS